MAKYTQQELMAAHNVARHNSDKAAAAAASDSTVVEIVDPNRQPLDFPYVGHPFGNNDNNRRVAQRIAEQSAEKTKQDVPLTPKQAALTDLQRAAEFGSADAEPTEEEDEAAAAAAVAAALGSTVGKDGAPPVDGAPVAPAAPPPPPADGVPSWKGNA